MVGQAVGVGEFVVGREDARSDHALVDGVADREGFSGGWVDVEALLAVEDAFGDGLLDADLVVLLGVVDAEQVIGLKRFFGREICLVFFWSMSITQLYTGCL